MAAHHDVVARAVPRAPRADIELTRSVAARKSASCCWAVARTRARASARDSRTVARRSGSHGCPAGAPWPGPTATSGAMVGVGVARGAVALLEPQEHVPDRYPVGVARARAWPGRGPRGGRRAALGSASLPSRLHPVPGVRAALGVLGCERVAVDHRRWQRIASRLRATWRTPTWPRAGSDRPLLPGHAAHTWRGSWTTPARRRPRRARRWRRP